VNGRVTQPPHNPIAVRLIEDVDSETRQTVEVMALVGFVGRGRGDDYRLFSDMDYQRYMDIPPGDIVDSAPLDDGAGRTVVWVRSETMFEPLFSDEAAALLADELQGSLMSTWILIPGSRYVAAQLLDLVPRLTDGEGPGPHLVPRPPDDGPAQESADPGRLA
jgi:hypothetical protein